MSSLGRRAGLLAVGAVLFGCAADFGFAPGEFPPPPPQFEPSRRLVRIREDFNNRELIESQTGGIVVDTNRGIVTLESQTFPSVSGGGAVSTYDRRTHQNGLIEAGSIIVHEGGTLEASDSVELRAEDRVIIAGALVVGRGGITIIARQRIQIDGTIISEGPVRLLLGDDTGTIQIDGSIDAESKISIYGRGSILIGGIISTFSLARERADIEIYSYGDVVVTGATAQLSTSGEEIGGNIAIQSESNVTIENGARLGVAPELAVPDPSLPGGDIDLRATNVTIGDDAIVSAAGSNLRQGGKVHATATGRLLTGHRAQIIAGRGAEGGNIIFRGKSIELGDGTRVAGASGSTQPGLVTMQAVESISLFAYASIEGGSGQCARGGDIFLEVGGLISAAEGVRIVGGAGGNANCGGAYPGGSITVFARSAVGVLEAIVPGQGAEDGAVNFNLVDGYTVPVPNLQVSSGGYIESRTIDRGEESISTIPRLVEIAAQIPPETSVTVLLAGAREPDGPFDLWLPINDGANDKRFESFIGQRFVRYRVMLDGRRFDVPIIDYFEIDLAPLGY